MLAPFLIHCWNHFTGKDTLKEDLNLDGGCFGESLTHLEFPGVPQDLLLAVCSSGASVLKAQWHHFVMSMYRRSHCGNYPRLTGYDTSFCPGIPHSLIWIQISHKGYYKPGLKPDWKRLHYEMFVSSDNAWRYDPKTCCVTLF